MTDLRKAAEQALEILDMCFYDEEDEVYCLGGWHQEKFMDAREALRQALAQINPDIGSGYAGVRIWIGDKTIKYSVTKVCIEQEMIEGLSMKLAFDSCLKALKEKNT